MQCTACKSFNSIEDGFCRSCGVEQTAARLPVRAAAGLPARWGQAVPVVARGAALVAAGLAAEWLLSYATRRARSPRKGRALARRGEGPRSTEVVAVTETLVVRRRTLIRR